MTTYHLSKCSHKVGAKITRGAWGRFIKTPSVSSIGKKFEYYLEAIRLEVAPNKVSRLDCVFTLPTKEDMEGFILTSDKNMQKTLYTIDESLITLKSSHNYEVITYFKKLFPLNNFTLLLKDEKLMYDYWLYGQGTIFKNHRGESLNYVNELLLGEDPLVNGIL